MYLRQTDPHVYEVGCKKYESECEIRAYQDVRGGNKNAHSGAGAGTRAPLRSHRAPKVGGRGLKEHHDSGEVQLL